MLTKQQLEDTLNSNPLIHQRLQTLKLAEQLNPKFESPHIVGGYLRNIALGAAPKDCDVVFQGYQREQPGILEAVREAESQLGITPYPEWEFENITATGFSDDFYENTIGKYSNHTDYLTLILMDSLGQLYIGDDRTLSDIETRTWDLRFAGVDIWVNHRAVGRSYASCLTGDLIRGLYLGQLLHLNFSGIATFLLNNFDLIFNKLELSDQEGRKAFWIKKTKGDSSFQPILDRFSITSLGGVLAAQSDSILD
jgi:hypothetical protein